MLTQDLFLGAGGLIGISAALLGEAVPGHGSAVAVGNAMAMGPPVFHIPQALVDHVRERAAAGERAMQHLELDMFRSGLLHYVYVNANEGQAWAAAARSCNGPESVTGCGHAIPLQCHTDIQKRNFDTAGTGLLRSLWSHA